MNNIIELVNEEGKTKKYILLSEFELEGRKDNYILFTDNLANEKGGINIYYGILKDNNKIEEVKDKKDIQEIEEYIIDIEDDLKSGIEF